jgi:hypothetical protein
MTLHGLLFPMAYAVAGGAVLRSRRWGVRLVGSVALTESVLLIVYTVLASFPFPGSVWIKLVIWGALPLGLSLAAWRLRH